MSGLVPAVRVRELNASPVREDGKYVLYWMTAYRRTRFNFALDRAVEWCRRLKKPLLVFEPLRIGYEHASDRLHTFVMQGMEDNAAACAKAGVTYFSYVEPEVDADKGLLAALASEAALIVTDDWPCFFLPRMQKSAAGKVGVRLEAIDSNGLFPMRATERVFVTAFSFRAFLQKELEPHLAEFPAANPLSKTLGGAKVPAAVSKRWKSATDVSKLAIDHTVAPVDIVGGQSAAHARLKLFLNRIEEYPEARSHPDVDGSSRFSPWLHFGHLSTHEVFTEIAKAQKWSAKKLKRSGGKKEGYWGMSVGAEAFIDELVTWRELAFNYCSKRDDTAEYSSLPGWARATLEKHASDERRLYSFEQLDRAQTHDDLWNAAQTQLARDGWFHNYLRMLWGKKILEWSPTPEQALRTMERLMNRYSLDGRDPCSYSGYAWVLGRYDRPWGPERKVFGTIRYMSSDNTKRKVKVREYLKRYAGAETQLSFPVD